MFTVKGLVWTRLTNINVQKKYDVPQHVSYILWHSCMFAVIEICWTFIKRARLNPGTRDSSQSQDDQHPGRDKLQGWLATQMFHFFYSQRINYIFAIKSTVFSQQNCLNFLIYCNAHSLMHHCNLLSLTHSDSLWLSLWLTLPHSGSLWLSQALIGLQGRCSALHVSDAWPQFIPACQLHLLPHHHHPGVSICPENLIFSWPRFKRS